MQLTAPTSPELATEVERCPLCHDALRAPAMHVLRCRSCETLHHQTCLREFAGCGTIGCESRASQPGAEPKAKARVRATPREGQVKSRAEVRGGSGWLVGSLILAWLSVPMFWLFGLLVSLGAGALLAKQGRKRKAVLSLLLTPLVALPLINVLFATGTYWGGTAELRGVGLPGPNYRSLDPVVRCSRRSSGCLVDGSEVLTQTPHNLALRAWGALCGPMPGAYDGPLPTLEEALTFVREEGLVVSQQELEAGQIQVGARRVEADLEGLDLPRHFAQVGHLEVQSLWFALYQERALIVVGSEHVLLIDLESGRVANRWWARVDPERDGPAEARRR